MTMDGEAIFIDTNLLIYATSDESPFQCRSVGLINRLMKDGIPCVISPQIIREYLVVFTRGLSPTDPVRAAALSNIHKFLETFILLDPGCIPTKPRPLLPKVSRSTSCTIFTFSPSSAASATTGWPVTSGLRPWRRPPRAFRPLPRQAGRLIGVFRGC